MNFDISEKTYWRIMRRIRQDSVTLTQVMDDYSALAEKIDKLYSMTIVELSSILRLFFETSGHSFMQPCITLRLTWSS